jgi:esterase/lipase
MRDLFALSHKKNKDVTVLIHGFGQKSSDELKELAGYLKKHGQEVILFDYFRADREGDTDESVWIERAETKIKEAFEKYGRVFVCGFSMGGVIASYLASIYPVTGLILAAPAFYPYDVKSISNHAARKMGSSGSNGMSSEQTSAFQRVVSRFKNSIEHVDCRVLLLHGTEDEIISPRSSEKAFAQIGHENKRLVYLYGGKHRFLYDGTLENIAFPLILDFIEGKIFSFKK